MANVNQMRRKFQFAAWIIGLSMGINGLSLAQVIPFSTAPLETATTTIVNAGNFVVGNIYTIANAGTTSFTSIGASANTVGTTFTATGAGSGTGSAATSSPVQPNVMFMLDDSGSMAWDYMPDPALNFSGQYGFNSSQCNGMTYNPNITYTTPVTSTGATINAAAPTTFSAAYLNGFVPSLGTVNLNSQFTGGSGSGQSGENLAPGPAFYYTYTGTQTLPVQQNYFNTSGTFYQECNSNIGSAPGNAVFTPTTMTSNPPFAPITVSGGTATLTVSAPGSPSNTSVSGIKVGLLQIMSGATNTTTNRTTLASYIVNKINACTAAITGSCGVAGYSATQLGNVVTIYSPGVTSSLQTPVITIGSGNLTVAVTTSFPAAVPTQVTSITANGTSLLAATAPLENTSAALATDILNGINAGGTGCSATQLGSVVSVSCPFFASGATPVISSTAGGMPVTGVTFSVQSPPAQTKNFANWYSYYSHRMIMMKTVAGQVFSSIGPSYRVGFMTMNNNVSPDFVDPLSFNAAQKSAWFSKFYASIPGGSTPLRDALSHVGQLYAHKFGTVTKYNSTITVKCSNGSTGTCPATDYDIVNSVVVSATGTVNDVVGGKLFDPGPGANCPTDPLAAPLCSSASGLAAAIANAINAMVVSDYGATASGNVVTITGPPPALGIVPLITDSSPMTETATAFTATTTTAQLNGVTPLDPMQYSCQQNFVILDTDGYWNTGSTDDLNNNNVGNTDGTTSYTVAATAQTWGPETRPMLDALNTSNTLADVAEYYYQTDLRDPAWGNQFGALGNDVSTNNVPTTTPGVYRGQNMVTFTLGLGARGNMTYSPSYLTDTSGDYYSILNGLPASGSGYCATNPTTCICNWQATAGSICNWSVPSSSGSANNIDDLWHAAVNGRGQYFSATDPASLLAGLKGALLGIHAQVGAASAGAVSSPVITQSSNSIFSSTYTTDTWDGNVAMNTINPVTGQVSTAITWCTDGTNTTTAIIVIAGNFSVGSTYTISSVGTTNFTAIGASANTVGTVFTATGTGSGTGTAISTPTVTAGSIVAGNTYTIASVGTTSFTSIGASANTVGTVFTATGTGSGTGTATVVIQGFCPVQSMLDNLAQTDCPSSVSHHESVAGPTCATPDISVSRKIYTFDSANSAFTYLKSFVYGNLTPTEQNYFNTQCSSLNLSQCANSVLTVWQMAIADNGLNMVDFLRGNQWYESPVAIYRQRFHIEGDSVNAEPVYVQAPTFNFTDATVLSTNAVVSPSYTAFQTAQAARQAVLYVGSNDGMLHAFNAATGAEMWAYVPKIVMPNLYKLADVSYPTQHQYYVDGTPQTMDIYVDVATNNLSVGWHTILVGGLSLGGRGFYALDVTNPSSPQALWEICSDNTLCAISDTDMGYSYGNPVITKRSSDGKWVVLVTSGYFNGTYMPDGLTLAANPGSGQGALFELDAVTGAVLNKTLTGTGSPASPSGLAKISPWIDNPQTNMTTRFIYGGDLNGNVWRFDLGPACSPPCVSNPAIGVTEIASLKDSTGAAQPVTTRPQLGDPLRNVTNSLAAASGQTPAQTPAVFVGTGEYFGILDLGNYQVQSIYAIKDSLSLSGVADYYGNPRTHAPAPFVQQFISQTGSGATAIRTTSNNIVNWTTNSGWYADFSLSSGERVNIDPQLVNGTLILVTNVPNTTACVAGGTSWLYSFNYSSGSAVSSANGIVGTPLGGGNSLTAGFTLVSLLGGQLQAEVTASTGFKYNVPPPISAGATKRTSWRELIQ